MAIETTNPGYVDSGSYFLDPNNVTVPDQTHQEYQKGIHSWIMAALPGLVTDTALQEEVLSLKQAQGLLAIRQAILNNTSVNSNYYYAVDEYEDESGVNATNMNYNGTTDSFRTSTGVAANLLIQSEETAEAQDGAQDFRDLVDSGRTVSAIGNAQTSIPTGVGADVDPYGGTGDIMSFDGAGDAVQVAKAAWHILSGDFTIAAWFKPADLVGNQEIACGGTSSGGDRSWEMRVATDKLEFRCTTSTGLWESTITGTTTLSTDTWYYAVATRSGSTVTLYLDAVSEGTDTLSGALVSNVDGISVGMEFAGGGQPLNGDVSEFRLWNGSVKAATVPTSRPAYSDEDIYLVSDVSLSNVFVDTIGTHTVVTNGDVVHSDTATAKFGSTYIDFPGTNDYLNIANAADFDFVSGDFTIDAWIYPTKVTGLQIIACCENAVTVRPWNLYLSGTTLSFLYGTTGTTTVELGGGTVAINTWQHVAIVRDGNNLDLYLDGTRVDTQDVTGVTFQTPILDLKIGIFGDNSTSEFQGYLEEFRLAKGTAAWTSGASIAVPIAPYDTSVIDAELDSISFTAGTAPTKIAVVMLMDPVDPVTINTDYIISVSPTATYGVEGTDHAVLSLAFAGVEPSSGANIYVGEVDVSTLTSGTTIRYFLRGGGNQKDLIQHAAYVYYAD